MKSVNKSKTKTKVSEF